jgi:hypothetical protein
MTQSIEKFLGQMNKPKEKKPHTFKAKRAFVRTKATVEDNKDKI